MITAEPPAINGNGYRNGNGQVNGNGHETVIELKRTEDPQVIAIIREERLVHLDNSLPYGARLMWTYVKNCSLWNGHNVRPGVVRFSNSELATKFGCCEKTIQNWKRDLCKRGRCWVTEKRMRNCFGMSEYHVTVICGQAGLPLSYETEDGLLPEEDTYSSNRRRMAPGGRDGLGRWSRGGQKTGETPNEAQITLDKTVASKNLPPSTAIDFVPPRQPIAAHGGNGFPPPAATSCRGSRQPIAVADGNTFPPPAATNCRLERKQVADLRVIQKADRDTGRSLSSSAASSARKSRLGEKEWLLDLGYVVGPKEMANWGGRWRNRYRENPDKARRVLAELRSMARENKITRNAGACADDLWKRFAS